MFGASRETVERLRKEFPSGARVVLDHMEDMQAPPAGTMGNVIDVDDIGTIFVRWDTGSCLGVAYGEDKCHVVK